LPPSVKRPVDSDIVAAVAPLLRERTPTLADIAPAVEFLFTFEAPEYPLELLAERAGDAATAVRILDVALTSLDAIAETDWDVPHVEAAIRGMEAPLDSKLRKFVSVLYVAEMGRPQGIPLFDSMVLLGRERALQRLRTARLRLG
jgi:glutamyl-tRNA synthetase